MAELPQPPRPKKRRKVDSKPPSTDSVCQDIPEAEEGPPQSPRRRVDRKPPSTDYVCQDIPEAEVDGKVDRKPSSTDYDADTKSDSKSDSTSDSDSDSDTDTSTPQFPHPSDRERVSVGRCSKEERVVNLRSPVKGSAECPVRCDPSTNSPDGGLPKHLEHVMTARYGDSRCRRSQQMGTVRAPATRSRTHLCSRSLVMRRASSTLRGFAPGAAHGFSSLFTAVAMALLNMELPGMPAGRMDPIAVGQKLREDTLSHFLVRAQHWHDWDDIKFGLEHSSGLKYPQPYKRVMRRPNPDKPRPSWGGA